ncbi:MAG TPA: hypothetical protein VGV38_05705 [Pyrinomonadaceae bacterium]|nr:hypothetical protein [Pyrinomonadaceae bacterium]
MGRTFDYNAFEKEYELRTAQLPFVVSLPASHADGRPARGSKLTGHTRRISAGELELVGPFTLFNSRTLLGQKPTLALELELAAETVSLQAVAISYTLLDEDETGLGYLLADDDADGSWANDLNCVVRVRITHVEEPERQKLLRFLRKLNQPSEQTIFVMGGNGRWQEDTLTVTVLA